MIFLASFAALREKQIRSDAFVLEHDFFERLPDRSQIFEVTQGQKIIHIGQGGPHALANGLVILSSHDRI